MSPQGTVVLLTYFKYPQSPAAVASMVGVHRIFCSVIFKIGMLLSPTSKLAFIRNKWVSVLRAFRMTVVL